MIPSEVFVEIFRRATVYGTSGAIVSKTIRRQLRDGVRCAVNYHELRRTVELRAEPDGRYSVQIGPSPAYGGGFVTVFSGHVNEEV